MESGFNQIFDTQSDVRSSQQKVKENPVDSMQSAASLHQWNQDNDKGTSNYLRATEMCQRAFELGHHDNKIKLDSLNLKGICLFRLGELIESVQVLQKARNLNNRILEEQEERRRAREKKEVDEVVGYFTQKDHWNIYMKNKKRSKSFQFERHIKMRRVRTLNRDVSWGTFEQNEKRVKMEIEDANMPDEESSDEAQSQRSNKSYTNKNKQYLSSNTVTTPNSRVTNETRRAVDEIKDVLV